jgi:CBS domain-containing protein
VGRAFPALKNQVDPQSVSRPSFPGSSGVGFRRSICLVFLKLFERVYAPLTAGLLSLLSERDIVRALAERGARVLTEPLARVMTRTKSTCTLSEPVNSIMEQMTAGKFRHVPVVEQEQLVGIVSIGDVVKHRLTEMERESEALHEYIQKA